ncbi:hypothetical protein AZL_f00770 (plasmid) [Azospirillum sp. B510]|uniref:dihydrofolate reductase family protein n=1 Tax=Azospirillum sp. (strain B510) TaxID=137722 RepID=UPI0001C4CF7B|nr:dihydrofolate reductase family protein [Azospirillum sp. B510]BAI76837.1 hypothetical protein AZL_f00770 [Azospirillum sp. B510]
MRIIYYAAISADGFLSGKSGEVDWLEPFQAAGEDYGYAKFFSSIDGLIMGRKTYDQILTFGDWPYAGKPVWMLSSGRRSTSRQDVTVTSESPGALAQRLSAQGHRRVWMVGGTAAATAFEREELLTDYVLTIIPVFLGVGQSLFNASVGSGQLTMAETRTFPNGVVQVHHKRP